MKEMMFKKAAHVLSVFAVTSGIALASPLGVVRGTEFGNGMGVDALVKMLASEMERLPAWVGNWEKINGDFIAGYRHLEEGHFTNLILSTIENEAGISAQDLENVGWNPFTRNGMPGLYRLRPISAISHEIQARMYSAGNEIVQLSLVGNPATRAYRRAVHWFFGEKP